MAISPFNVSDMPAMTGDLVTPNDTVPLAANARRLRCTTAANLVLRFPNSAADITIAVTAGEYVPVGPGVLVKVASTTTPIHVFGC